MTSYGHAEYALARARAFDVGKTSGSDSECPYPAGSPEARSWQRGWASEWAPDCRTLTTDDQASEPHTKDRYVSQGDS